MADDSPPPQQRDRSPCELSRRRFLTGVASATAGVAALEAGTGLAAAGPDPTDTEVGTDFDYVYRNTALGEEIPTSVQVADAATLDAISTLGSGFRSVTDPVPGAYVRLTRTEAVEVYQTEGVEAMRFAPGANPFWRLDEYPGRVFPDSGDALDYIAYDEALAGLDTLASANPDRVDVRTVGRSPGHVDRVSGEPERYDVTLVECTNDVSDDAAMAEKEKVLCSLGIHGDERAGVEAGLRFLEAVLRGEEPDVASRLDDVALLFVLPNPDGWASRSRLTDVQAASSTFKRVNASGVDPNRQYPTVGWIDPEHNPAEPNGSDLADDVPGIDDDVDERYTDTVPDSLGVVEALREYENYAFAADFHGMFGSENLIEGLLMNDRYRPDEHAVLDELNRAVDASLDETVGPLLEENRDALEEGADRRAPRTARVPENPYSYGTILDTIGYTTTGGFGSWFSDALEYGGIDAMGVSFEMALDNRNQGEMAFIPGLNEVQVTAYQTCMREMVRQSALDLQGTIDAQGRSTAYVDTDALTRSSADLNVDTDTRVERDETTVAVGPAGRTLAIYDDLPAEEGRLHLAVDPETGRRVDVELRDPTGAVAASASADGGGLQHGTRLAVPDAGPGPWELSLTADADTTVRVRKTWVVADGAPSPMGVLGYEQRPYEVTPLDYLDEYGGVTDGADVTAESVDAVAGGGLVSGGGPVVDNLVVPHADGADNAAYLAALDDYVAAGGNLVLTDTGLDLLGSLEAGGASSISGGDVSRVTRNAGALGDKRGGELLENVRGIEREVWKAAPVGYRTRGQAPLSVVDEGAFEAAGGTVAATTGGEVILGELDGITVVGTLLPPANQENLHPFGVYGAAVSRMGNQLLVNALGHSQTAVEGGDGT
ncbi:M14 family zinc carboxypeptidase [Haloarchaeobius iranensis]|uniref:Zinc carboxypeptidase n=1 Tax=Haloarchaeobius iranensis TaxID=996166 RepID=A0A1G9YQI7_9EURY|nr:M14 family zinc carboxypeptidase [Haloarchaeobius iranensis]SDN10696.1 Zinc carboxypeptidase [Haloarchaeobius iranensis]